MTHRGPFQPQTCCDSVGHLDHDECIWMPISKYFAATPCLFVGESLIQIERWTAERPPRTTPEEL